MPSLWTLLRGQSLSHAGQIFSGKLFITSQKRPAQMHFQFLDKVNHPGGPGIKMKMGNLLVPLSQCLDLVYKTKADRTEEETQGFSVDFPNELVWL